MDRSPRGGLLERKKMESAAWSVRWQDGLRFIPEMRQGTLCRTFGSLGRGFGASKSLQGALEGLLGSLKSSHYIP